MRKSKAILAAVAGLGLASMAQANPVMNMGLILRDATGTSGAVIAPTSVVGGVAHYSLPDNTFFRVEASVP